MRLPLLAACICVSATAGDLDSFLKDLNIQAKADLNGFSARIAAQFQVGDLQVKAVLETVGDPADAFMVFQLGQFSGKPVDHVLQTYKAGKGKGWGALAKELGIKPGSPEFHALKRGDLRLQGGGTSETPGPGKGRGKGHGKGRGKD